MEGFESHVQATFRSTRGMPACRDAGNAAMPGRWLPRSAESLQRAEPLEAARNGTRAWEGTNYRRFTASVRGWTWAPTSCKLMSDLEPALFFARRQPVVLVGDSLTRNMFNSIVDSVNMHPDYAKKPFFGQGYCKKTTFAKKKTGPRSPPAARPL